MYKNSYALLFGIDDYTQRRDQNLKSLKTCVKSARQIYFELLKFNFKSGNIKTFLAPSDQNDIKDLPDVNLPTRENILDSIRSLESVYDDRILIYFSGHGEMKGNEHFLIPYTGSFINTGSEFLSIINTFAAKHIFVILDACYSGLGILNCFPQDEGKIDLVDSSEREFRILTSAGLGAASDIPIQGTGVSPFGSAVILALSKASAPIAANTTFSADNLCSKVRDDLITRYMDITKEIPIDTHLFKKVLGNFLFQAGTWNAIPDNFKEMINKSYQSKELAHCDYPIELLYHLARNTENKVWYECFQYLLKYQTLGQEFIELINKKLVGIYNEHFKKEIIDFIVWIHALKDQSLDSFDTYSNTLGSLLAENQFSEPDSRIIRSKINEIIKEGMEINDFDDHIKSSFQSITQRRILTRSYRLDRPSFEIKGSWKGFWEQTMGEPGGGFFDLFIQETNGCDFSGTIHEPVSLEMMEHLQLSEELLGVNTLTTSIKGEFNPQEKAITFTQFNRKELEGRDIDWNTIFNGEIDFKHKKIIGRYFIEIPEDYFTEESEKEGEKNKKYHRDISEGEFYLNKQ